MCRSSIQRHSRGLSGEKQLLFFCPSGDADFTTELENRSFSCYVDVTFFPSLLFFPSTQRWVMCSLTQKIFSAVPSSSTEKTGDCCWLPHMAAGRWRSFTECALGPLWERRLQKSSVSQKGDCGRQWKLRGTVASKVAGGWSGDQMACRLELLEVRKWGGHETVTSNLCICYTPGSMVF